MRGPSAWIGGAPSPLAPARPCGKAVLSWADACGCMADGAGLGGRLPGRDGEHVRVGPAVVLGQDLAEIARPVRDGAVADLTSRDRKMRNGHREAAGTLIAHHFHDSSP